MLERRSVRRRRSNQPGGGAGGRTPHLSLLQELQTIQGMLGGRHSLWALFVLREVVPSRGLPGQEEAGHALA